ncbi:helix-turn-helix domain-containing protein [Cohnella sp. LGH]|uniref:helix-turn-helix domain-containing protein n=1 Tax=Cohnella sp. LGH TaxID=1619153 RepID=UPI001ADB5862|nr:helix-turn-helix transcriptional regulator [Cohnella sp. LGH]QTH44024.1 helix-turn-helix domain-containing protein [Cohnella sp. LGH]
MSRILHITSQRVREIRELKGLSHEQLASSAGLSRQFIKKFEDEQNNISLKKLDDIATALNIETSDLLQKNNPSTKEELLIEQIVMLCKSKSERDLKVVIALLNALD